MADNKIARSESAIKTNTSKPDSQPTENDALVSANGKKYACAKVTYIYTPFLREDRKALTVLDKHLSHFTSRGKIVKILVDSPSQTKALREYFEEQKEKALQYKFCNPDDLCMTQQKNETSKRIQKEIDEIMGSVCSNLLTMTANDVLYINSHGASQYKYFMAPSNTRVPTNSSIFMKIFIKVSAWLCGPRTQHSAITAQTLVKALKLPPNAKIRTTGCNSAVGTGRLSRGIVFPWISKGLFWKKPWSTEQKLEYLRSHAGDFSKSLAGSLEAELIKRQPDRKVGLVGGYLRETSTFPSTPDQVGAQKTYAKNAEGKLVDAKTCFPVLIPKHSGESPYPPAHFWGLLDGLPLSALLLNASVDIKTTTLVRRKDLLRTA